MSDQSVRIAKDGEQPGPGETLDLPVGVEPRNPQAAIANRDQLRKPLGEDPTFYSRGKYSPE